MACIKELTLSFTDWEIRAILESLSREKERLKVINSAAEDEGEAVDAGNDYFELAGLSARLSEAAVEIFGEQITKL